LPEEEKPFGEEAGWHNLSQMCFGCGCNNNIGLKLQFHLQDGTCWTTFIPAEEHQGWDGCMHGGLVVALLDEVMAQWLWLNGISAMTAEMTTRYSFMVPLGQTLRIEAERTGGRGRLYEMAAKIILPDGKVAVKAKAKFLRLRTG
jgi:acyl-coenzyme A thioesterase PaaI-like protein